MTTAPVVKHPCARCGKKDTVERMVYSTFTRNRYCRDFNACDKRFRRGSK